MLYFIKGDRGVQTGNKAVGVALGRRQNAGIIEGQILAAAPGQFRGLHQSALAGLPGAVDQNGRGVRQGLEEMFGNVATNHDCIINHTMDDNQPKYGRQCLPKFNAWSLPVSV